MLKQTRLYPIFRFWAMTASLFLIRIQAPLQAAEGTEFPWGQSLRILFFGDSITQAGGYITDVDAFLFTRFATGNDTVINHGISSETISGTSEPDHDPRRPNAQDRFQRDVENWEPDVLVACFGMNDGNYLPPDLAPFDTYKAGVAKLIERTMRARIPRLVLMTPPPFDPYKRGSGDPNATYYGYKYPAIDYDQTLDGFSNWLLTLNNPPDLRVIDLHTALNRHLRERRKTRVSFYLAGDAVHPNATGHLLMAATLLKGLGHIPPVATADIDAKNHKVNSGHIKFEPGGDPMLRLTWTTPLPWPLLPEVDPESLKVESISETFNRLELTIHGLEDGLYEATGQGSELAQPLGSFESKAGRAVAKLAFPDSPAFFPKESAAFRAKLEARNQARYAAWRKAIQTPDFTDDLHLPPDDNQVTRELHEMAAARPWVLTIHAKKP